MIVSIFKKFQSFKLKKILIAEVFIPQVVNMLKSM